jgi:hypothetical protein
MCARRKSAGWLAARARTGADKSPPWRGGGDFSFLQRPLLRRIVAATGLANDNRTPASILVLYLREKGFRSRPWPTPQDRPDDSRIGRPVAPRKTERVAASAEAKIVGLRKQKVGIVKISGSTGPATESRRHVGDATPPRCSTLGSGSEPEQHRNHGDGVGHQEGCKSGDDKSGMTACDPRKILITCCYSHHGGPLRLPWTTVLRRSRGLGVRQRTRRQFRP